MPRLFALDRNFPQPIVDVLSDFQIDATLVSLDQIDKRMSTLDDWELLLALHHHADPWDGQVACNAFAPVLSGGSGGIGLLQDEGLGLGGVSGSVGVYYRPFNTTSKTFEAPVEISNETLVSYIGAEALSSSQDAAGGIYAAWADTRGVMLAYSTTHGTSWQAPEETGIKGTDAVVAGTGCRQRRNRLQVRRRRTPRVS